MHWKVSRRGILRANLIRVANPNEHEEKYRRCVEQGCHDARGAAGKGN